jgi:hypothetical protein
MSCKGGGQYVLTKPSARLRFSFSITFSRLVDVIVRAGLCRTVVHASSNEVSAGIASAAVGSAIDILRALSTRFATFIDIFSCSKLINDVCCDKIKTRTKQRASVYITSKNKKASQRNDSRRLFFRSAGNSARPF